MGVKADRGHGYYFSTGGFFMGTEPHPVALRRKINQGSRNLIGEFENVEVKGSKIHGEKKSDYLFIVWFKENYRIKHISFIPTAEIVKNMGTCQSYEVDPTNYEHCLAASYEELEKVSWKKYLYDHSFIKNWFSKKEML